MKACLHLTENRQKDNEADKVLLGINALHSDGILSGDFGQEHLVYHKVILCAKKSTLLYSALCVSTMPGTWPCAISTLLLEMGSGK